MTVPDLSSLCHSAAVAASACAGATMAATATTAIQKSRQYPVRKIGIRELRSAGSSRRIAAYSSALAGFAGMPGQTRALVLDEPHAAHADWYRAANFAFPRALNAVEALRAIGIEQFLGIGP